MFPDVETLRAAAPEDAFVIGGASVYRHLLPWCDTAYVTKIDRAFPRTAISRIWIRTRYGSRRRRAPPWSRTGSSTAI